MFAAVAAVAGGSATLVCSKVCSKVSEAAAAPVGGGGRLCDASL